MFFRDAIPGTQYLVTVTEPISGKSLSQTIYLPKAPTYSRYGARPQGGTVTWISHADKQAAANVYRANFTYYQTLSSSEFNNKSKDIGAFNARLNGSAAAVWSKCPCVSSIRSMRHPLSRTML